MNPGEQFEHYRIDSVVSRDGATTLYHATDLRTNQAVAIKIPHPGMEADPAFLERFRREEEIGKTLNHPGVVKMLEGDGHGRTYMVGEWFDGQTLRKLLSEQTKLSHERAVRIAVNICGALEYIHNHGIVHRNLRPENTLVNAQDQIKLINFGLALKTGAERITFVSLAQMVGASPYVSPEEIKGQRGDARSDIYSLGVILYEMLTGKPPFEGSEPFERLQEHPVPPRELDPEISPQLQEVVYRAMEREHKNRYAHVHEFAVDLTHLDRVGVAERPELREWKEKKRTWTAKVALYAAVGLLPLLIFGLLLYLAHR